VLRRTLPKPKIIKVFSIYGTIIAYFFIRRLFLPPHQRCYLAMAGMAGRVRTIGDIRVVAPLSRFGRCMLEGHAPNSDQVRVGKARYERGVTDVTNRILRGVIASNWTFNM
jgi:hypothetical protein